MPNQVHKDVVFFHLDSWKAKGEGNMHGQMTQPKWNQNDKDGSLERYADWLNQIAREAFLESGHHPQMFIFFTGQGEIEGCQFPEGIPRERRDDVVYRGAERINPFGTIQILMLKICDPKLFPELKQQVHFIGSGDPDPSATERDCLMVRMESRTGRVKVWANPVILGGDRPTLMDAVETYPAEDAGCESQ
jgi:hypothetical protein